MSADDPHACLIEVRRKRGNIGIRFEAQHVETKEWVEVRPLTPFSEEITGILHVEIGHLQRLAPEGVNTRVIFEEMPAEAE
jgi:hypothetical protein